MKRSSSVHEEAKIIQNGQFLLLVYVKRVEKRRGEVTKSYNLAQIEFTTRNYSRSTPQRWLFLSRPHAAQSNPSTAHEGQRCKEKVAVITKATRRIA